MKERTSAGISGLQFGHLKYFSQSPLLYDFEAPLSHITYTTVYEPEYWKKFINVMLEKKGKGVLISNLRTI